METSQGALDEVVARVRRAGTDLLRVEVKAAVGGVPKSVWPTVSSFSNRGGGLVILGLDENQAFAPADGFDALAIRDAVAEAFRPRRDRDVPGPISPQPSGSVDIAQVDGRQVVIVDVDELATNLKPAFVTSQGKENGSYERVGDGDRRMSTYGVFLLSTSAEQPREDSQAVSTASIDDLDERELDRFIIRVRRTRPRSLIGLSSRTEILRRHNVLAADERTPTVAGLLCFGWYPQQFFPQAMITFAVYPGRAKESVVSDIRMLDRKVIEGPIPVIVEDTVSSILDNLRIRRVSRGVGATDEPEIPVDALREAVVNALAHRDYSPTALGDQVRVEMYPDRVEVSNPGDIWGGRRVIDLFDGVSRSRNALLSSLLTEVPLPGRDDTVSENSGSGIPRMAGAMGRAGLAAPRFAVTATNVTVSLDRHGLRDPEGAEWLTRAGADRLPADSQRALIMVHRGQPVDDQVLRTTFGMDSEDAKRTLRELVEAGWLAYPLRLDEPYRSGRRLESAERTANSLLPDVLPIDTPGDSLDARIVAAIAARSEVGVHDLAVLMGSSANALRPRLRVLIAQRAIVATAAATSRYRRYRLPGD